MIEKLLIALKELKDKEIREMDVVNTELVCGGQSGTGAGFLRVLRFPLPIVILPISPSS
jgi:hypothetical protein